MTSAKNNKEGLNLTLGRNAEKALAAFRGIPFQYGDQENRRVRTLADLLPGIINRHSIDGTSVEQRIMDRWEKIVGSSFAPFSYLMKIDRGKTAVIGVTHAIARQELSLQKRKILRAIKATPGAEQIAFLSLRAG
ncbi:MAG: DUF721 domain-containing protein [Opitutales bacterium]|nr:DUF721 domain-containing protein [Opitutales bacterium]MCH8541094.1 DUF721 domain-containing protein [Opitutales bacterium]